MVLSHSEFKSVIPTYFNEELFFFLLFINLREILRQTKHPLAQHPSLRTDFASLFAEQSA